MNNKYSMSIILASVLICSISGAAYADECGLSKQFDHKTKRHGVRPVFGDGQSLLFNAPMAVNTDGAPNSYHPADPWGNKGLAINTICNGANAKLPNGKILHAYKSGACKKFVPQFEKARDENWESPNGLRIQFYGVATEKKNGPPCIINSGKYKGYFTSQTSLAADGNRDRCDPERYLNSLTIPFAIYPKKSGFSKRGVGKGDVVIYYNKDNGLMDYGLVGDAGPTHGMAEGSIAFAQTLKPTNELPKTRRETYRFGIKSVVAVMLPQQQLKAPYTAENVRSRAREAFEKWGGTGRLKSCIDKLL